MLIQINHLTKNLRPLTEFPFFKYKPYYTSMKILITTTYLVISLVLGSAALGINSNFKTGIADYKKTDFANVIDKWILLDENGNAEAQHFLGSIYYKGC